MFIIKTLSLCGKIAFINHTRNSLSRVKPSHACTVGTMYLLLLRCFTNSANHVLYT